MAVNGLTGRKAESRWYAVENQGGSAARKPMFGAGKISVRFRCYNMALFALIFLLMAASLMAAYYNIARQISADYVRSYASSSADALSAHITKEIALMAKAARSQAVIDWLNDEGSGEKKVLAYKEMSDVTGELYSNNLYVGFEKSLHEYEVENDAGSDVGVRSFDTLDKNDPYDTWYFNCIESDKDYMLSIGIDYVLQRKRVWLDYKVVQNGVPLGVLCTGLEFSHVARELFSHYNNLDMRGIIIDEDGVVNMDSSLLRDENFLRYDFEARIEEVFTDPAVLTAVKSHLDNIEGYFEERLAPTVIKLSPGPYRYVTITPIRFTNWSAVILYDSSKLLRASVFLPVLIIMLALLAVFTLGANTISNRLIFFPLERLVHSLARLRENQEERIYGIERSDEFGNLSNTIQDLFNKANYDALTGIYNRRYMENNFHRVMAFLSRSSSLLSVFMIDIDYFKKYNDTYGHEEGDACLKAVALALSDNITRTNDFVARYGGEEFVVVLPHTNDAGAIMVAQRMLDNVRKLNIPHAANAAAPYVTASIGITTGLVDYTQCWANYVKRADEALYMSKQNGRNQYTYLDF